ncbi:MAG: CHAT domain-containing protein, partial [Planctomycetota bacterium]|nr:CHAT domain-containing protein [Planctomycetota bacterium]
GLAAYVQTASAGPAAAGVGAATRARAALDEGMRLKAEDDLPAAAATLERAAKEARAIGWLALASEAHYRAGQAHWDQSDYREARAHFNRNLEAETKLGSEIGQGRAHFRLCLADDVLGNGKDCKAHRAEARRLAEVSQDAFYLAKLLSDEGMRLGRARHGKQAIEALLQARSLLGSLDQTNVVRRFRVTPDQVSGAQQALLLNLASMHAMEGQVQQGRPYAQEAVAAAKASGVRRKYDEARAFLALLDGVVAENGGDVFTGLGHYKRAARYYKASGRRELHADALRRLAAVESDLGDLPGALRNLQSAIVVLDEIGDRRALFKAYELASTLAVELGRLERGEEHAKAAMRLAMQLDDPDLRIDAKLGLASVERGRGDLDRAMRLVREADQIAAAHPDQHAERIGIQSAQLLCEMGDSEGALARAKAMLASFTEVRQRKFTSPLRRLMGRCQANLGRHDEALAIYFELLDAEARIGDRQQQLDLLYMIVQILTRAGRYEEGIEAASRAIGLAASSKDPRAQVSMRLLKGVLQVWHGESEDGLEEISFALEDADELGDIRLRAHARQRAAEAHYLRREYGLSLARAREGVELGSNYGLERSETSRAHTRELFAGCATWGAASASRMKRVDDLYYFLERLRAQSVTASLGGRDRLRRVHVPPALTVAADKARAATALAFQGWLSAKRRRQLDRTKAARTAYEKALDLEHDAIAKVQETMRAEAGLADADAMLAMTAEEAQALVGPDEAFVVVGADGWHYVAVVFTAGKRRAVQLGAQGEVRRATQALLDDPKSAEAIAALRALVYAPLKLPADVKRVLLSPAQMMSYAPLSLLDPEREFAMVPSAGAWAALRKRRPKQRGVEVLALADPLYDVRVKRAPGVMLASRGRVFAPLPETGKEAKAIGDKVFLGAEATETRLRALLSEAKHWKSVHLACHGVFDDLLPTRSALVLSRDAHNDGFVHADEIHEQLKFTTDLVVLSACETGRGRIFQGEGLLGLSRAFLLAGAPRVLCSLWKVDDAATRALMTKFYELWNPKPGADGKTAKPLSATAALQQAQAHVRSQKQWSEPYYWAAWVLWGLPD